ncbi:putative DNA binding domain-containing protein [Streptomyces sp. PSRA5]|uniref:RNA-binding domain-containing protein n=1 Tax=Streptomyces panacea TaxID=3035064 RepID=UPI00339C8B3B
MQRAVENHIPESVDLDWKKDFYKGTDAGREELAKDVSAMADTAGGTVVIGVDDGNQDHANDLAPVEPIPGHSGRFPDALSVILAGSTAAGRATASSDLDLAILIGDGDGDGGETIRFEGRVVEFFVHTRAGLLDLFAAEVAARRAVLQSM